MSKVNYKVVAFSGDKLPIMCGDVICPKALVRPTPVSVAVLDRPVSNAISLSADASKPIERLEQLNPFSIQLIKRSEFGVDGVYFLVDSNNQIFVFKPSSDPQLDMMCANIAEVIDVKSPRHVIAAPEFINDLIKHIQTNRIDGNSDILMNLERCRNQGILMVHLNGRSFQEAVESGDLLSLMNESNAMSIGGAIILDYLCSNQDRLPTFFNLVPLKNLRNIMVVREQFWYIDHYNNRTSEIDNIDDFKNDRMITLMSHETECFNKSLGPIFRQYKVKINDDLKRQVGIWIHAGLKMAIEKLKGISNDEFYESAQTGLFNPSEIMTCLASVIKRKELVTRFDLALKGSEALQEETLTPKPEGITEKDRS